MRRTLAAASLALLIPAAATACLWDSDTPAQEAMGLPEVIAAITGRFTRNPPLYYEMRLARVADRLKDHPDDLDAYDDAGVACDRLGRGDEAVAWMEKKRTRLDALDPARPEAKEHRYRHHANLGTFLVHRWAKGGADRSNMDDVKAGRAEIAKALEINPDAHFGRERWQLRAIDWILNPPAVLEHGTLPNLLGWPVDTYEGEVDPKEADSAARGLAGLVVLGNAWESVDVFHALRVALGHDSVGFPGDPPNSGRNALALLAWLRACELVDAGKGSMLPGAPKGEELKKRLQSPGFIREEDLLSKTFRSLRAEADARHAARTAFLLAGLRAGRHPDTDPDFWRGYTEPPAPSLPATSVPDAYRERMRRRNRQALALVLGLPALIAALIVVLAVRANRRDRRDERSTGRAPRRPTRGQHGHTP